MRFGWALAALTVILAGCSGAAGTATPIPQSSTTSTRQSRHRRPLTPPPTAAAITVPTTTRVGAGDAHADVDQHLAVDIDPRPAPRLDQHSASTQHVDPGTDQDPDPDEPQDHADRKPGPTGISTSTAGTAGTSLPSVGLAGVNDPDCRSADPPVLLLHGTLSTPRSNFGTLAPALRAAGRCVYAIEYGARFGYGGIGPVRESATDVAAFARQVLELTDAEQLDVVGYSQGGLIARTMLRYDLDPGKVRVAVLVAPSYHGTTSPVTTNIPSGLCPACEDQTVGSALLTDLATGGDLAGNVRYAVLSTSNDVVVTPVSSQVPQGPADRVRSAVYEEHCSPGTDHVDLIGLGATARWVQSPPSLRTAAPQPLTWAVPDRCGPGHRARLGQDRPGW